MKRHLEKKRVWKRCAESHGWCEEQRLNHCRFFFLPQRPHHPTFSLPPTLLRTSNKSKDSNHKVTQCWWQSEDACCMQIKVSKLLTAAGVSAVCILSADCRRPGRGGGRRKKKKKKRNALDTHLLMHAQNGCLDKQIHGGAAAAECCRCSRDFFLFPLHAPPRSATSERPRERPRSVPWWWRAPN